jgi:hypothetical protein
MSTAFQSLIKKNSQNLIKSIGQSVIKHELVTPKKEKEEGT